MGWGSSSYAICAANCLLVCFIFIGFTRGVEGRRYYCDRSWCGGIQIRYPFRLKGDPAICGYPNYELTCSSKDNRTLIMEFASIQYLVKQINYYHKVIHITDADVLSSNCSLPHKILQGSFNHNFEYHIKSHFQTRQYHPWLSIMKCSKKLANSESYKIFPCQTTNDTNDSYVYGVVGNKVANLAPSCSFLSWMPTINYDPFTAEDILLSFQNGHYLSWEKPYINSSIAMMIRVCLRHSSWAFHENFNAINSLTFISAVLKAEMDFVDCIFKEHFMGIKIWSMWIGYRYPVSVIVPISIVLIIINFVAACRFVFAPLSMCIFVAHKFWSNWSQEDAVEKFLRIQGSLSPTRSCCIWRSTCGLGSE